MPTFECTIRTKAGAKKTITEDADSGMHLRSILKKDGSMLITLKEVIPPRPKDKKIKTQDLIDFANTIMYNIDGGLSIPDILTQLAEDTENKYFMILFPSMARDVKSGESFGDVCSKYPIAFPKIFSSIVRSGEKSGELTSMLRYLVKYLKWDMAVKRQIKGMMIYPISVLVVAAAVSTILLVVVFPIFLGILDGDKSKVPPLSAFMISISDFLIAYWHVSLIGIVSFFFTFRTLLRKSIKFRDAFESSLLKMPIFGKTYKKILISRVANNLALMMKAGLPILSVIDETKKTVSNKVFEDGLDFVREETKSGNSMSDAFKATDQYSQIFNNMMKVGETTGNIEDSLTKVTDYYDEEIPAAVDTLMKVLEPLLLVFILTVVGSIILSFIMLMYTAMDSIGG